MDQGSCPAEPTLATLGTALAWDPPCRCGVRPTRISCGEAADSRQRLAGLGTHLPQALLGWIRHPATLSNKKMESRYKSC